MTPATATKSTDVTIDGRHLVEGDYVTISGEGGAIFKFFYAKFIDGEIESICVFGGPKGRAHWRHFRPSRITSKKRLSALEAKGLI